MSFLRSK